METTSARRLAGLVGDLTADRGPRYAALAERVRQLVADGSVPLGTRLPAERDLATALQVSRATVSAGYARLPATSFPHWQYLDRPPGRQT